MTIPPYLKKGDTIGITCPAGYMPLEKAQTCIDTLQQWGFKVKVGKTLGNPQENYFSGNDIERLTDLQEMMDDENIKAVLCGRGGYGVSRIIDDIDFKKFRRNPKWIIGYSDISVLHSHLNRRLNIASIHSHMAAAFNDGIDNLYIDSIKKILTGKSPKYKNQTHPFNQYGKVQGELVGGNLCLLAHTVGSKSELNVKNKILFLEDVGEYLYNVDRMMIQLKRAGWFDKIDGLILGSFSESKDTEATFGKVVEEILKEHLYDYDFPYCFNFPVGHTFENVALKCGVQHELNVTAKGVTLTCME